ncbi:MAG TPA: hypothetical protein VH681_01185, partial [Nitrospiraceae bacterium]
MRLLISLYSSMTMFVFVIPLCAGSLPLDNVKLPPGFAISVYADNVPNARQMVLGANGTLFVGTRGKGDVYAVVDKNGDQRADVVFTIARGLQ